jgi:hypothetical protein
MFLSWSGLLEKGAATGTPKTRQGGIPDVAYVAEAFVMRRSAEDEIGMYRLLSFVKSSMWFTRAATKASAD